MISIETTRAAAHIQHRFRAGQFQQLGHQGDHVGLRNALAVSDLQRLVPIAADAAIVRDELLARDGEHGAQDARIADAALAELAVHHAPALGRPIGDHCGTLWGRLLTCGPIVNRPSLRRFPIGAQDTIPPTMEN
jgi:hypothetical protein